MLRARFWIVAVGFLFATQLLFAKQDGCAIELKKGYRATRILPSIMRKDRPTRFVYYQGDSVGLPEQTREYFRQRNETLMASGKPGLEYDVFDASGFKSEEELIAHMKTHAAEADVIVIGGHGNPFLQVLSEEHDVNFTGRVAGQLDLRGKTLFLDGCTTGGCVWDQEFVNPNGPNQRLVGKRIGANQRLLDQSLDSGADHVVGTTRTISNSHNEGLDFLDSLILEDGGMDHPAMRSVSKSDETHDTDTSAGMNRLGVSAKKEDKMAYVDGLAARKKMKLEHPGSQATLLKIMSDPDVDAEVMNHVLEYAKQYEPKLLDRVGENLPANLRHKVVVNLVKNPSFVSSLDGDFHNQQSFRVITRLAGDNETILAEVAAAIPVKKRIEILFAFNPLVDPDLQVPHALKFFDQFQISTAETTQFPSSIGAQKLLQLALRVVKDDPRSVAGSTIQEKLNAVFSGRDRFPPDYFREIIGSDGVDVFKVLEDVSKN